ncbi:MAG: ABC transporter permease [Clostridia bacterium]|nr:ABC transporter permease [Clostridia bacterium]
MNKSKFKDYLIHNPDSQSMVKLTVLYVLLLCVFGFSNPNFLTMSNFSNIFKNTAELGIIAIGVSMVVITGRIDLSISSTYCFAGITFAVLLLNGMHFAAAMALTFVICVLFGVINGIFVGYMGLQPVLVTTASQMLIRGLCYIGAGTKTVMIRGMLPAFGELGSVKIGGMFTIGFLVMIFMMVIQFFVLKRTRFGIMLLSVGNNPNTTRLSGYNTKRSIAVVYIMNSIIAWIAGMFMIARLQGVESTYGSGYEFTALTIVLMGGITFGGGKGNSIGLFLSAIAMSILENGMNLIGISSLYQSAIIGFMVLLMIANPDISGMRAISAAKRETRELNAKRAMAASSK